VLSDDNTLGKGAGPRCIPHCRHGGTSGRPRPDTYGEGLRPSTPVCAAMTAPAEPHTEPAPAAQAAPDIHLPPPAEPARAKARRRRGGGAGRHFGPRPVENPRSAHIDVRCTPAFRAKATADAKAAGLSLADYVHIRLGGSPGPRARRNPGPEMKLLTQILAQMGWRGSNLNQIARRFNMDDMPEPEELADAIAEHRATCAAIMRALGMRPGDADSN
jgi:hypothetical protein